MPSGNGARAAQKRERNAKQAAATSGGKSQLAVNSQAQSIICQICRQTFMCTSNKGDLQAHFDSKHAKGFTFEKAFPNSA